MNGFWFRLRFWRDHRWAPDRMSAYLDGDLGPRARGRLEAHVGVCRECRGVLTGLRTLIEALHRSPRPDGITTASQIEASVRLRLAEPQKS